MSPDMLNPQDMLILVKPRINVSSFYYPTYIELMMLEKKSKKKKHKITVKSKDRILDPFNP